MRVLSLTSNKAEFYKQQVSALSDLGVDVTTMKIPGDEYRVQSDSRSRSPRQYLQFVRTVLEEASSDFDLVHANYGLTAPAALAQRELPVVVSLWGSDLMGRFGFVTRSAARLCDEVVVMSEQMADELDQACHVIPHGVDLDRFRTIPGDQARQEVEWETDSTVVLFPYARERDIKNFPLADRVVSAVDSILGRDVEIRTISGVEHDRMPYYYNAADVLLLTSKREGSPNSVKESLACNCPVVSTDVGDVSDRVDGAAQSAVCRSEAELVERLVAIIQDGDRPEEREAVADIDLEQTTRRLKSVYETATA